MTVPPASPTSPLARSSAAPVLVLAAHPDLAHSRVNLALQQALSALPGVHLRDLYALYPDYHVDVAAEQAALAASRLVLWLHPIHWYGPTPLLKLWMDEVLSFGWAYGPSGHALVGKDLWLVLSTGGSEHSYHPSGHNRYLMDAFWPPYEQTAALTGLRFLPPLVLHGAHRATDGEIAAHVQTVVQRINTWPDWPEIAEMEPCPQCEAPMGERPEA
ncbi:putative NADPH-quinone reductase (modulator of drug activity B) [Burkholderiales bacterium JOSHI_001]|nr:putative NADPH-quinone reductase (modulator of drug activity B) [Burkholderiales bacterium JOSHI_001]